jgi:hypothetical protein
MLASIHKVRGITSQKPNQSVVYSVIRQVHNLFPNQLTKQCDLVFHPSISSILSFP